MPISPAHPKPKPEPREVPCLARWLSQPAVHGWFAAGLAGLGVLTLSGGAPVGREYLLLLIGIALCTLPHSLPPKARAWCRAAGLAEGAATRARQSRVEPPARLVQLGPPPVAASPQAPAPVALADPAFRPACRQNINSDWQHWVNQAERALAVGRGSDYRYALYRLRKAASVWAQPELEASIERIARHNFAAEARPESREWLQFQLHRLKKLRLDPAAR